MSDTGNDNPARLGFEWSFDEDNPHRHPYEFVGLSKLIPWFGPVLVTSVKSIYHYTSAAGVEGIISGGMFRGTNFSFLNDASELEYGRDLIVRVTECELQKMTLPLLQHAFSRAITEFEAKSAASEVYVSCFSAACDLLSQWRAYGAPGARYCIEVDTKLLAAHEGIGSPFYFDKLIYDKQHQEHTGAHQIRYACEAIEEEIYQHATSEEKTLVESASLISTMFLELMPFFKHPGFAEEVEWRAVAVQATPAGFDTSSGILCPFVKP
jgi:hypothetical protein